MRFAANQFVHVSPRERFDAKWVRDDQTGCWLWQAAKMPSGYGFFGLNGRTTCAHRAAWELYRGPIPTGLVIDHVCRVRGCVNPDHLRVTTPALNTLENSESRTAFSKQKTHCHRGHPFSGDNLRFERNGRRRACRKCNAMRQAKYDDKLKSLVRVIQGSKS